MYGQDPYGGNCPDLPTHRIAYKRSWCRYDRWATQKLRENDYERWRILRNIFSFGRKLIVMNVAIRVVMLGMVLFSTSCSLVRMGGRMGADIPIGGEPISGDVTSASKYAGFTAGLSAEWFLTPTIAFRTDPTIRFTTLGADVRGSRVVNGQSFVGTGRAEQSLTSVELPILVTFMPQARVGSLTPYVFTGCTPFVFTSSVGSFSGEIESSTPRGVLSTDRLQNRTWTSGFGSINGAFTAGGGLRFATFEGWDFRLEARLHHVLWHNGYSETSLNLTGQQPLAVVRFNAPPTTLGLLAGLNVRL